MTSEITHSFLKSNELHFIYTWKNKGFSEFIVYDKNVNIKEDSDKYNLSKDKYIKYRIAIAYMLLEKKMTFKEIITNQIEK